jgi:hypothetical protein
MCHGRRTNMPTFGNNPINMWVPTGNVPEWVRLNDFHYEFTYYNEEETTYTAELWYFIYYTTSEYDRKVSETRYADKIVEYWIRSIYEDWRYDKLTIEVEETEVVDVQGLDIEYYSYTDVYSRTVTITAQQLSEEAKAYILQYVGELPQKTEVSREVSLGSYSSLNGVGLNITLILKREKGATDTRTRLLQTEFNTILSEIQ